MSSPTGKYDSNTAVEIELQSSYHDSMETSLLGGSAAPPKGWPTLPGVVKSGVLSIATEIAIDIVLLALSLSFLAFAMSVRHYDQVPISDLPQTTKVLLSATKYGPSVFPILFACVLGRASHAMLVWRLEKGEKIGTLDILAGSTSLTSTVTSQLKLRILSILGFSLVLIWSLSPIGGQGCLRQMTLGGRRTLHDANFTYMVQRETLARFDTSSRQSLFAAVGATFNAALLAPPKIKASPLDTFGNVKIPRVEEYEASSTVSEEGWYNTTDTLTIYASLVGIPMAGTGSSDAIDYTTNIESRYLHLDCPVVGMLRPTNLSDEVLGVESYVGFGAGIYTWENTTERRKLDLESLNPLNFTYDDYGATGNSQCLLTTTYVESKVFCATSLTCRVTSIRRSRLPHPQSAYTLFDTGVPGAFNWNWKLFAFNFVREMAGHPYTPTAVQGYLTNPDYPALEPYVLSLEVILDKTPKASLPKGLFAIRLGQLINTYWDNMVATYAIPGGLNEKTADMNGNSTDADRSGLAYSATSNGTKATVDEVIQAHDVWTTALMVASAVMIFASFVNPIISCFLRRGPDVMLNVSSLATRDSPFIALPTSGSFMDASDRARLVKGLRVRFGDVESERNVGRLAVGTVDLREATRVMPIGRKRLYV